MRRLLGATLSGTHGMVKPVPRVLKVTLSCQLVDKN